MNLTCPRCHGLRHRGDCAAARDRLARDRDRTDAPVEALADRYRPHRDYTTLESAPGRRRAA